MNFLQFQRHCSPQMDSYYFQLIKESFVNELESVDIGSHEEASIQENENMKKICMIDAMAVVQTIKNG